MKRRSKPRVKFKKYTSTGTRADSKSNNCNEPAVCLPFGGIDDSDFSTLFPNIGPYQNRSFSLPVLDSHTDREFSDEDECHENIDSISAKYYLSPDFNETVDNSREKVFSMIHFNARSLSRNFDQIHAYLSSVKHQFSVIGISETWINPDSHTLFSLDGYHFIHADRPSGRGGGVALFIREDLNFKLCNCSQLCKGVDYLCIDIDCKPFKNIIVGIVYRQPKSTVSAFTPFFEKIINDNDGKNKRVYFMGDFNIDLKKKVQSSTVLDFINTVVSSGFYPLIDRPTRVNASSATLIDNIYTNFHDNAALSGILVTDISDHFPIFHISQLSDKNRENEEDKPQTYRKISKENLESLAADLASTDWSKICESCDVESSYNLFHEIFIDLYNKHLPIQSRKHVKRQRSKKPWVSAELLKLIEKKNFCYKNYINSPHERHKFEKYKKLRNDVTAKLRRAKRHYYFQKFDVIKNNSKDTWKLINTVLGKQKKTLNKNQSFSHKNTVITNPIEISERFNEYFVKIGSNISSSICNVKHEEFRTYMRSKISETLFFKPATKQEILDIGKSLKSGKSCGFDDINQNVVKYVLPFIIEPILHICNSSLSSGIVPSKMKLSKVTPVFKKDDPSLLTNYRPISILPCFSKILEKIVFTRLYNFLSQYNLLYESQYGFRQNHSTDMAVIEIHDRIIKELNSGKEVLAIFMDLSKAFDTLSHEILLDKLQYYGVRGVCLEWFKSYLSNRQQYTVYNSINSSMRNIKTGVPQGSILGPLLFLIYINDIVNSCSEANFILYADDTSLLASHNDFKTLIDSLNKNLAGISKWFKCNKLSLNVNKTQCIYFKMGGVKHSMDYVSLKIDKIYFEILRFD